MLTAGAAETPHLGSSTAPRRGAAAAINAGVRAARFPIDLPDRSGRRSLEPGWLRRWPTLRRSAVGAVQGRYIDRSRTRRCCARVMALDLEQRYARDRRGRHRPRLHGQRGVSGGGACGTSGLLDEALGYGYDNDLSYRLRAAGYRLSSAARPRACHRWREGLARYWRSNTGLATAASISWRSIRPRLAAIPCRRDDDVASGGDRRRRWCAASALCAGALAGRRGFPCGDSRRLAAGPAGRSSALVAGMQAAARRSCDHTASLFPPLHLPRDAGVGRRHRRAGSCGACAGLPLTPRHSMRPRARNRRCCRCRCRRIDERNRAPADPRAGAQRGRQPAGRGRRSAERRCPAPACWSSMTGR